MRQSYVNIWLASDKAASDFFKCTLSNGWFTLHAGACNTQILKDNVTTTAGSPTCLEGEGEASSS